MSDITQKPEKLASAVYLISGFFADQEPLKWKLRTLASELITYSVPFRDNFISDRERKVLKIEDVVLEICSLFGVAKNAGLVSDMNYNLIIKEFGTFAEAIKSPENKLENKDNGSVLSSHFFKIESQKGEVNSTEESKDKGLLETENIKDINEKQTSNNYEKKVERPELLSLETNENIKIAQSQGQMSKLDESILANTSNKAQPKPLKDFGAVSVKKNSRQSIIIGLLKRKKEIMIKDVSPLISGCSEKTIQRELLGMVEAGILRKIGEKRWSRYSLIQ